MAKYKGKVVTIAKVDDDGSYLIEEDDQDYWFTDGMLEPALAEPVHTFTDPVPTFTLAELAEALRPVIREEVQAALRDCKLHTQISTVLEYPDDLDVSED